MTKRLPKAKPAKTGVSSPAASPAKPRAVQGAAAASTPEPDARDASQERPPTATFPVVGIGASAGGLEAFTQLLKQLPPTTGMAFVLIQHLDPTHTSFLREALAGTTAMIVSQAEDGATLQPNHVYVIPPSSDIGLRDGRLALVPRSDEARKPHLPIDFFFRALAEERGNRAIGVVLSGTASDGTEGLRAIKAADGITLAQEPGSAKFGGMPRSAVEAGVVDFCLGIPDLARELVRLSHHPYVAGEGLPPPKDDDATLAEILGIVQRAVGVNFTEYKAPSFERRLARRMALRRVEDFSAYLTLLKGNPEEARLLYEDLLIHVTSFFRDPELFESLKAHVFPEIVKDPPDSAPIRFWVAGCSTGEEVYSLAIALLEFLGPSPRAVQIFGSDVSGKAVEVARAGVYTDTEMAGVSDERKKRYFVKVDRGERIAKAVRDRCVFVQHDLGRDPPFSRLDFVSCRNVLIYFGPALQKRVLLTFHYALKQPGFLLLGRSENISGFGQLFLPTDKTNKVFKRSSSPSRLRFAPRSEGRIAESAVGPKATYGRPTSDLAQQLDRILLARYAPPGVLVNERLEILQFRGQTGSYLQAASGDPQNNLIKMAREGLAPALHATLARAKKDLGQATTEGVEVEQDGFTRTCNVVVTPFAGPPETTDQLYLVLFEEAATPPAKRSPPAPTKEGARRQAALHEKQRVPKLEHELAATKQYLEAMIHEHGQTTDELGSANEELVSGNEELQSLNEELETAKEELQSINEELTTVNDELHSRNQEVTRINTDLVNLLGTVEIPVVILDMDRRIRRFTPDAQRLLNVLATDVGRPFDDIRTNLAVPDLDKQIAAVIATFVAKEEEVKDRDGRWYRMQIRPYRTVEGDIDGAILSLVDIDALKHHVAEAQEARASAERANRVKDEFLATLSHELRAPLSSMLLYAQLVRRGGLEGVKLQRAGEAIERGITMQLQLIDDLLDVSRIVTSKLKMDCVAVDLRTVVEAALEGVHALAEKKGMHVEVNLDPTVRPVFGAPARLQQVVSNLLVNAIKFTPEGGRVTISLDSVDGEARLTVTDTGIGIEPGFLPEVFGRFTQENSSITRTYGGLGLGLAIVRHLVDLHGGSVRAESAGAGLGSTFTVTLPLLADRRLAPAVAAGAISHGAMPSLPPSGQDQQLHGVRVLVVDDDAATGVAVGEILTLAGAEVSVAESAARGLAVLGDFAPQVLVSDVAMPGEDGYAFIRSVRALGSANGGAVPALALTALAGEEDRQRALAAGFQMHLAKPVDIDRLTKSVAKLSRISAVRSEPSAVS